MECVWEVRYYFCVMVGWGMIVVVELKFGKGGGDVVVFGWILGCCVG